LYMFWYATLHFLEIIHWFLGLITHQLLLLGGPWGLEIID